MPGVALVCLFFLSVPAAQLGVSHHARSIQPGEVVRLSVRGTAVLDDVRIDAFGKRAAAYREGDGWDALIGIGLSTKPGPYVVRVEADAAGGTVRATYTLQVKAKTFATRRLTVAPEFATPPARELPRIQRETAQVSEIFSRVTPQRLWDGAFVVPVPGQAVSTFGRHSIVNGSARSRHLGGDFRAAEGEPLLAPAAGRIVLVAAHYFGGNIVIVDHGLGLYSYFAHLSSTGVVEGDVVQRGQALGKVGQTGRVTGPHVHWAVAIGNTRVDPVSLVAATGQ